MLTKNSEYYDQVELLLKIIPHVMKGEHFALKGGTAINLFLRNMPRLSIDIDLTYIILESRQETLRYINDELPKIINQVEQYFPEVRGFPERTEHGDIVRLIFYNQKVQIKVDVNHTLRGYVQPCVDLDLCKNAQEEFKTYASIRCMSFEDLYAGKICAALDRQHPRDIFDVKILLDNEGYTETLRKTFILYLISNNRPISESLNPIRRDIINAYSDFQGMAFWPIDYEELIDTRENLIRLVNESLTDKERLFLISLKKGDPDWSLVAVPNIAEYPSVRWKLLNIQKMSNDKRHEALRKLEKVLLV